MVGQYFSTLKSGVLEALDGEKTVMSDA